MTNSRASNSITPEELGEASPHCSLHSDEAAERIPIHVLLRRHVSSFRKNDCYQNVSDPFSKTLLGAYDKPGAIDPNEAMVPCAMEFGRGPMA